MCEVDETVRAEELRRLVAREVGKDVEEAIVTTADRLRAEGRSKGRSEMQQEMLLKLLSKRFGALPEDAVARVKEYPVTSPLGTLRASANESYALHDLFARVRPGTGLYVLPYMPVLYFLTQAKNPTRYSYLAPGMMTQREELQTLQSLEQRPPEWVLYLPLDREEYLRVFPNAKDLDHHFSGIEQWIARNYTATGVSVGGYQLRQRRGLVTSASTMP